MNDGILGTFQLEQVKRPLDGLLEGKLHWATILAERKNIILSILDYTVATSNVASTLIGAEDNKVSYHNVQLDVDEFDADIESTKAT